MSIDYDWTNIPILLELDLWASTHRNHEWKKWNSIEWRKNGGSILKIQAAHNKCSSCVRDFSKLYSVRSWFHYKIEHMTYLVINTIQCIVKWFSQITYLIYILIFKVGSTQIGVEFENSQRGGAHWFLSDSYI